MIKKQSKENLFKYLKGTESLMDLNGVVKDVSDEDVVEFKIGNKYFYKLVDDSHVKSVHDELYNNFLASIPINNAATAYVKGKSYLHLFEPHQRGYYFLRLDISTFFHSISEDLLRSCFSVYFRKEYIDITNNQQLIDAFICLVTYKVPVTSANYRFSGKRVLPIGFMLSPTISNIVFRKIDILLQKYCSSKNIIYSRYADDMLFSSPKISKFIHSDSFINEIKYIISIYGFKVNKRKTIKARHTISLNGYVIQNNSDNSYRGSIRISNKKTKIIDKVIQKLNSGVTSEGILTQFFGFRNEPKVFKYHPPTAEYLKKYCDDQLANKLAGYRSYLISILKFASKYDCMDVCSLKKYKKIVLELNKYIR